MLLAAAPFAAPAQTPPPAASSPASADDLIATARAAARADRNRESADRFAEAIARAPQRRRELLQEYADQLVYSGRSAQAVPLYEEVLARPASDEERIRSLKGLGLALLWSDRPTRARGVYETLLGLQPQDLDARRSLGRALSWSGRQREAVEHLQALLRDRPRDDEARMQLSQAQACMGRPDLADQTLAGLTGPRDDARKLAQELAASRAPLTTAQVQQSRQSDLLDIRGLRLGHAVSFDQGRGMAGIRLDRFDYEREDGSDAARVTRPMLQGRYRFTDALELNAEAGRENIRLRGGGGHEPTVYSSWLTWWPNDVLRFDLSTGRSTFDNLRSLRLGLTSRQYGLSGDFTPTERQRYTLRAERAYYSDGNERWLGQAEGEYRLRTHPEVWVGAKHRRMQFERLLNNGYFNPLEFEATQITLRTQWQPDGPDGRWDVGALVALGREHAVPGGSKPANDFSLRAAWRLDPRTRLEARAKRFTSRTADTGFARTTFGLALERSW